MNDRLCRFKVTRLLQTPTVQWREEKEARSVVNREASPRLAEVKGTISLSLAKLIVLVLAESHAPWAIGGCSVHAHVSCFLNFFLLMMIFVLLLLFLDHVFLQTLQPTAQPPKCLGYGCLPCDCFINLNVLLGCLTKTLRKCPIMSEFPQSTENSSMQSVIETAQRLLLCKDLWRSWAVGRSSREDQLLKKNAYICHRLSLQRPLQTEKHWSLTWMVGSGSWDVDQHYLAWMLLIQTVWVLYFKIQKIPQGNFDLQIKSLR